MWWLMLAITEAQGDEIIANQVALLAQGEKFIFLGTTIAWTCGFIAGAYSWRLFYFALTRKTLLG